MVVKGQDIHNYDDSDYVNIENFEVKSIEENKFSGR